MIAAKPRGTTSSASLSLRKIAAPDWTSQLIGAIYALCITAVLLAFAASLGGCGPTLTAQSPAPPGRSARLDEVNGFWGVKSYRMELSTGVALAVTCYHRGGPCKNPIVTSDDPAIAEVHSASLGTLEQSGIANQQTSSAVVIVGKAPGTTKLHVHTNRGRREVAVTIIAPPVPSPPAAVAR